MACNRQPRRMGYSATEARFRLELDRYLACIGPHNAGLAKQQLGVILYISRRHVHSRKAIFIVFHSDAPDSPSVNSP